MIIAGAGGHAREIFMLLQREVSETVYFFDNVTSSLPLDIGGSKVLWTEEEARTCLNEDSRFIIGTGNPVVRKKLYQLFKQWGGEAFTFRASTALVSEIDTTIGAGANIMHDAFVSSNVIVGKGCLVNARAHLHHDVVTGEFCEIGPAAILLGGVTIGEGVMVGAGAILLPGVRVGNGAVIGAGAVLTKSIAAEQTVKGMPAK